MIGSPHEYRREAAAQGRTAEQIDRAVADSEALSRQGVATVLTLSHLSRRTAASYPYLRSVVRRAHDPYHSFTIARRDGKAGRPIAVPEPVLMEVQRWLLKRVLHRLPPHHASFAYHPNCSIKTCAQVHCGARWLVKLDLHDFFTHVREPDVYGVFLRAGYAPLLSLELARLCTRSAIHASHVDWARFGIRQPHNRGVPTYQTVHLGYLPQGAPTSGSLANLVARPLDERLAHLAKEHGAQYTRYADDMTFSVSGSFSRSRALQVVREATDACRAQGFEVHRAKTRIVPPGSRHIVLGLLVDGPNPRLSKHFKSRVRTHIHGVAKHGLPAHASARGFTSMQGTVNHVRGLIRFAFDIEPEWASQAMSDWTAALRAGQWPVEE